MMQELEQVVQGFDDERRQLARSCESLESDSLRLRRELGRLRAAEAALTAQAVTLQQQVRQATRRGQQVVARHW
jgi:hypothetical protein